MDKFDKSFIDAMRRDCKFDGGIVRALDLEGETTALVRVRNPLHMGLLERNFDVTRTYPFIRSVGIRCSLKDAIRLERMREVEYVSAQGKVLALEDGATKINSAEHGSESEKAAQIFADSRLDGRGVTLCVMDTGINLHSDLSIPKDRIVHFADFVTGSPVAYDDNGHGTFVAGVAAGNGTLSGREIRGVAPMANIVGVKVIGANGESGTFKILDGMQWLFDNFRQYGIRVVCMSFGAEPLEYSDPLKIGAEMLSRSGLIVVAASGNGGKNALKSPAISNEIISVGAVDEQGKVASFTSRGVYHGAFRPDVYADGVDVHGIKAGGTYSHMTGTSAAAPYVAGACCLLCQKYGRITPAQAKNAIISSCKIVDGSPVFKL